ncbi:hypothetical protein JCM8547_005014 [Rhodosporidiobolus lusitaniae]
MPRSPSPSTSTIFNGCTFLVLGPSVGITRGGIARLVTAHGGKVVDDEKDFEGASHVIVGAQAWSRQGTAFASYTNKKTQEKNGENTTEEDPHNDRIWLLPVAWIHESIENGEREPEEEWDLQLVKVAAMEKRERKRKAELAEERKQGKKKFKRGERVKGQQRPSSSAQQTLPNSGWTAGKPALPPGGFALVVAPRNADKAQDLARRLNSFAVASSSPSSSSTSQSGGFIDLTDMED